MKINNALHELEDFVKHQAAEDADLPSSETSYQEQLVSDVLGQEAPSNKARKQLLKLYQTERQAAGP